MKRAIIFDLYDTLITIKHKTVPYSFLCCKSKNGFKPNKLINLLLTSNNVELQKLLDVEDNDMVQFSTLLKTELESVVIMKDVMKDISELSKKYRLFLLSNLSTPYKEPFLNTGLDKYFEKLFFSCDIGYKKPDLKCYEMILEQSKLNKEEVIMIGDSFISDYKSAQDFGIDAILRNKDKTIKELTIKSL